MPQDKKRDKKAADKKAAVKKADRKPVVPESPDRADFDQGSPRGKRHSDGKSGADDLIAETDRLRKEVELIGRLILEAHRRGHNPVVSFTYAFLDVDSWGHSCQIEASVLEQSFTSSAS